jgi:hypothetical protein
MNEDNKKDKRKNIMKDYDPDEYEDIEDFIMSEWDC